MHAIRDKPISQLLGTAASEPVALVQEMQGVSLHPPAAEESPFQLGESPAEADSMDYKLTLDDLPSAQSPEPMELSQPNVTKSDDINRELLIISCVHGAAAMLEDEESHTDRKTERVRILIDLLSANSEAGLSTVTYSWRAMGP